MRGYPKDVFDMYHPRFPLEIPWRKGDYPPEPIVGYEGYFATPSGVILRALSLGEQADVVMGRFRVCKIQIQNGYCYAKVAKTGGRQAKQRVHRLVVSAFERPPEKGEDVDHLDGNREHNSIYNLRICTATNNMRNRQQRGATVRGSKINTSKLHAKQVRRIRELAAAGVPKAELASRYGVSDTTIYKIVSRETWKHV